MAVVMIAGGLILDQVLKILDRCFGYGWNTVGTHLFQVGKRKEFRDWLMLKNYWREGFESMSKKETRRSMVFNIQYS